MQRPIFTKSNKAGLIISAVSCLLLATMMVVKAGSKDHKKHNVLGPDNRSLLVTADKPGFSIHLPSNPTTGYQWFVKSHSRNITPKGKTFKRSKKQAVGAGGQARWHFTVNPEAFNVPHALTVTLVYKRPWEHKAAKTKTFHIHTSPKKSKH